MGNSDFPDPDFGKINFHIGIGLPPPLCMNTLQISLENDEVRREYLYSNGRKEGKKAKGKKSKGGVIETAR